MQEDGDDFSKVLGVLKTVENLKITVVPDMTLKAGLNDQPFDATLDSHYNDWFEKLKTIWLNCKKLKKFLVLIFFYISLSACR